MQEIELEISIVSLWRADFIMHFIPQQYLITKIEMLFLHKFEIHSVSQRVNMEYNYRFLLLYGEPGSCRCHVAARYMEL